MKHKLIALIVTISFLSCSKEADDNYHYLSEHAKQYISYEKDEEFQLVNNVTQQTIHLKVDSVKREMINGGKENTGLLYLGPVGDDYYEVYTVELSSEDNCLDFDLKFFTSSNTIYDLTDDLEFEFYGKVSTCNDEIDFRYEDSNVFYEEYLQFNQPKKYTGLSKINSKPSEISISTDGIIYLKIGDQYFHTSNYYIPE